MEFNLSDVFGTAQGIGADQSYDQPRTSFSVPTNALQSMQPVESDGGDWGDFWRGTLGTVVGYAIANDVAKTQVQQQPVSATPTTTTNRNPMMPLIIGAVALVAVVVAVKVLK